MGDLTGGLDDIRAAIRGEPQEGLYQNPRQVARLTSHDIRRI